jgi:hypothetical protein
MGMGALEARHVLVTSCCDGNTSIPNAFTILGMFNIFQENNLSRKKSNKKKLMSLNEDPRIINIC